MPSTAPPNLMGNDWKEALQGYNDGMADFASVDPLRLLTACQIQLFDIDFAVSEVRRLANRAARAACRSPPFPPSSGCPTCMIPVTIRCGRCCSETGITILNHLDVKASLWDVFRRDPTPQKGIFTAMPAVALAEPLAFWILTGTLERFPKLKVVLVEPAWAGCRSSSRWCSMRACTSTTSSQNVKLLPSEYFKRQMGATFMYEPSGLAAAYKVLSVPDCLYWSTDFPHPATCWPNSRRVGRRAVRKAAYPAHDRKKIAERQRAAAVRPAGLGPPWPWRVSRGFGYSICPGESQAR